MRVGVGVAAALGLAGPAPAQEAPAPASADAPEAVGPGTPRGAIAAYQEAIRSDDLDEAARFLEVPARLRGEAPVLAEQLHAVLVQSVRLDLGELSAEPEGRLDDGLAPDRELVGEIERAEGDVPVVLVRGTSSEGGEIWRFAPETVARVPALHEALIDDPVSAWLPPALVDWKLFEVALWKWFALLAVVAIAGGAAWLGVGLLRRLAPRLMPARAAPSFEAAASRVAPPLRLLLAVGLFSAGTALLALPVAIDDVLSAFEIGGVIAAFAWLATRALDAVAARIETQLRAGGQAQLVALVPLGRRAAKIVAVTIAGLALLDTFGFEVTAVIAGLGVGGLAVALAAQRPLENLFSGITLFADRPVQVGDFCRFGDRVGTVEEIGLRSTRIRTLDRTVVAVPNTEFATMALENYARRDRIWYCPRLGLRYETSPDQLRYVLVEVRKMFYAHPRVSPDPARIRFVGFGAYSLDLDVFAYIDTADWGEYLEIAEDLNLRIMDIVERSGTGFAFPSVTTYVEQGEGMPEQRAEEVAQEVAAWREQGELLLPRFPEDRIAALRGSLDYPPKGSASNGGAR